MTKVSDKYLEERRQEILDAARVVFVEKGYDAATVNDIAAEAGVAAGSIYRYFASKADLIAAVAGECVQVDQALWTSPPPASMTPGQAFMHLGGTIQDQFATGDHFPACIIRLESYLAATRDTDLKSTVTSMLDESADSLAEVVRRAQQSGEVDDAIDARELARFLHAVGAGVGALSVAYGPDFDTRSIWNTLIHLVATGLLKGPLADSEALRSAEGMTKDD